MCGGLVGLASAALLALFMFFLAWAVVASDRRHAEKEAAKIRAEQALRRAQRLRELEFEMGRHSWPERRLEDSTKNETASDDLSTEPLPEFVEALRALGVALEEQSQPVAVVDILERVGREGHAVRLNWKDQDKAADAAPFGADSAMEWPTGVLPVIRDVPEIKQNEEQ